MGFYGSIGPTWAHIFDPKGWTDRGTSPVETEFGIRCHRIPLGSAVLGLGYYWILLNTIDFTPKFSASPNPKTIIIIIGETWRHIKIQQFASAHFGTCFHHPSWWRGLRDEFAPLSGLGLAEVFPVLNALSWAEIIQNASNHLDRCGEVMGIGDHHGHFEWVYYQFENVWKNNNGHFILDRWINYKLVTFHKTISSPMIPRWQRQPIL